MNPWYFQCCSVTAWKVPRWFCDSLGIMRLWLVWWMWCWRGNVVEGLQRPEGVNISKGWVRVEGMEQSHMAAENIREQWRMLGMKFYVTETREGFYLLGQFNLFIWFSCPCLNNARTYLSMETDLQAERGCITIPSSRRPSVWCGFKTIMTKVCFSQRCSSLYWCQLLHSSWLL